MSAIPINTRHRAHTALPPQPQLHSLAASAHKTHKRTGPPEPPHMQLCRTYMQICLADVITRRRPVTQAAAPRRTCTSTTAHASPSYTPPPPCHQGTDARRQRGQHKAAHGMLHSTSSPDRERAAARVYTQCSCARAEMPRPSRRLALARQRRRRSTAARRPPAGPGSST